MMKTELPRLNARQVTSPDSPAPADPGKRALLLMLAALPAACVNTPTNGSRGNLLPGPATPPTMRPPQVGQEWVYVVRNVYNHETVDTLTEKVLEVGERIRIGRVSHRHGRLPDEIQGPWGQIRQDPHWSPTPVFTKPVPLWPLQLKAGWASHFREQYEVLDHSGFNYFWLLNMKVEDWEEIDTPAGKFRTLKFGNLINYQSDEVVFRLDSNRKETIWLVPEIGRWALRRSSGSYFIEDRGGEMQEDSLEWELLSWK